MIITFSGTKAARGSAALAVAVYSVMSALRQSLKTVVLQFSDLLPVEDVLIGSKRNEGVADDAISNTGMDALVRYQMFSVLSKEHFNMCVTPVLKATNLLDLLSVSKLAGFTKDMINNPERIAEIITVAEAIYDNVLILFDGDNEEMSMVLRNVLDNYEHKSVVSILQGERQIYKPADNVNRYYIIHDYDANSFFSVKYYKKLCNTCNVCVFPHNVSFKDAYLSGDLLMFLRKNITVDSANKHEAKREDANAGFILKVAEFAEMLDSVREDTKVQTEDIGWEHKQSVRTKPNKRTITDENVFMKEEGSIKKQKVVTLGFNNELEAGQDSTHVSNYMYRTSRTTFDRLLKLAESHKRSINSELDYIVKNYIYYLETSKVLKEKNRQKKATSAKKALIS